MKYKKFLAAAMAAGFLLYRGIVWRGRAGTLRQQLPAFILVNAVSAALVVAMAYTITGLPCGDRQGRRTRGPAT